MINIVGPGTITFWRRKRERNKRQSRKVRENLEIEPNFSYS